jgi:hypothetical protein
MGMMLLSSAMAQSPPEAFGKPWGAAPQPQLAMRSLAPGSRFEFGYSFDARIVRAEQTSVVVAGGREISAAGATFVLVHIEVRNRTGTPVRPPLEQINSLASTGPRFQMIRRDVLTNRINLDPSLGGRAANPLEPGQTAILTAVYRVASSVDPRTLYYVVLSRPVTDRGSGELVLMPLQL